MTTKIKLLQVMPGRPSEPLTHAIGLSGICAILLGLAVLAGWHTRNVTLMQVHPAFTPMMYNTALGFIGCGVGLLSLAVGIRWPVGISGGVVCLLGALTLIEYLANVELGIDQLFMRSEIRMGVSHVGRMAPNTALTFVLAGAALMLARSTGASWRRLVVVACLGGGVAMLGLAGVLGYLFHIEAGYGWWHLTRMALHTAAGFVIVGGGLFSALWSARTASRGQPSTPDLVERAASRGLLLAFLSLALCLALTLTGWQYAEQTTRARQRLIFDQTSKDLSELIDQRLRMLFHSVAMLQGLYAASQSVQPEEFSTLINLQLLQQQYPGLRTVIFAERPSPAGVGFDGASEAVMREALERARDAGQPDVTGRLPLPAANRRLERSGCLLVVPIYRNRMPLGTVEQRREALQGFVVGTVAIDELMASVLSDQPASQIDVELFDGVELSEDTLLFDSDGVLRIHDANLHMPLRTAYPVMVGSRMWTVYTAALAGFGWDPLRAALPLVVLLVGTLLSVLFFGLLMTLANSRYQALQEARRMTAALRESERSYAELIAGAPDPIITLSLEGALQSMNPAAEALSGYGAAEVVGQDVRKIGIVTVSSLPTAQREMERIIGGEQRPPFQVDLARKDGTYFTVEANPRLIERAGTMVGVQVICRDVTERKRTDAAFRRQAALIRLLQVAAVAANQARSVEEALKICLAQVCESTSWPVGYVYLTSPAGSLVPTPIWHIGNPAQYEPLLRRFQVITAAACGGLPSRALASKQPVWTSDLSHDSELLQATIGPDLGIRGAFALPIFVGQDVVAVLEFFSLEAQEPDAQLLDVLAHIGTQLGRVVERQRAEEEIRASNKRLKELAALKDEFVAKVSHELRTPLTSIKEGLNLLIDDALGPTTSEQQDFLKTMDQDIDRLAELINNMLDISKIEAGHIQLVRQRADLGLLIDQLIQLYRPILGRRQVRRVGPEVPPVFADANRITQVLTNLLSNALKFTPDDGAVTFRLDRQDGMVVVAVEDTGGGIAPQELPKLFQKFSQVGPQGAGRPRGTGLGLVICKELIELHKGRVDVASVVGRGTTFSVSLPVYTDQFALTESFNELAELAKSSGAPEVTVIAIQAGPPRASKADEQRRLEAVAEDVRHHVHRRDLVLTVPPSWVVLLAATDSHGVQAIIGRLREVLHDGQRLSFGAAVSPEDGADAMALFAKATKALELHATSQDGAG